MLTADADCARDRGYNKVLVEVLFKLLRIALGHMDLSVPEGADWPAFVAMEESVIALARDGLQKCPEADPRLSLPLDHELKAVKYDCFGVKCKCLRMNAFLP